MVIYRVFRAQAGWTLTHTSHTEESTTEASITLDGITLTDSLIRWSTNEWPFVFREIPQWLPIRWCGRLISLHNKLSLSHYIYKLNSINSVIRNSHMRQSLTVIQHYMKEWNTHLQALQKTSSLLVNHDSVLKAVVIEYGCWICEAHVRQPL
jgi:hypothetical protein